MHHIKKVIKWIINKRWRIVVLLALPVLVAVIVMVIVLPGALETGDKLRALELGGQAKELCDNLNAATWGKLTDDTLSIQVGDLSVAGFIEIPALELALPVLNNAAQESQSVSICRYSEGVSPKDTDTFQLSGTYTSWQFGHIESLKPGDRITYTDILGNRYEYEVADVLQLSQTRCLALLQVNSQGETQHTVYCLPV